MSFQPIWVQDVRKDLLKWRRTREVVARFAVLRRDEERVRRPADVALPMLDHLMDRKPKISCIIFERHLWQEKKVITKHKKEKENRSL